MPVASLALHGTVYGQVTRHGCISRRGAAGSHLLRLHEFKLGIDSFNLLGLRMKLASQLVYLTLEQVAFSLHERNGQGRLAVKSRPHHDQ